MSNTMGRHLLALLSIVLLTCSVTHAKALEENEDEVLVVEKRDQQDAKEEDEEVLDERHPQEAKEEVLTERDLDNQKEEEVLVRAEKRDAEIQATETENEEAKKREEVSESANEANEVEDLKKRTVLPAFNLVDYRGRPILGQREGLLLFNGGTVCSDHFSMNSAHAICRTMGFSQATRYRSAYVYGSFQSHKRVRLDDVICTSTHWASCRSRPNPHCSHSHDIMLTCQGTGFQLINSAGNRVTGRSEGLLTYQHGTVCDDGFNMNAAHAICRVMGYANAVRWRNGDRYGMEQRHRPIVMDDVHCRASYWNYCTHRALYSHNCHHNEDVFLTCQPGHPHRHGFTLVNWSGATARRGCEALLLYNGGTVCDDGFNMNAAHAICRVLGFRGAVRFRSGSAFGSMQTRKSITMDDVSCRDTTWTHCHFNTRHNCNHSEDILLTCRP